MYTQACTHPDIAFAITVLRRYLSNLDKDHWRATKKVIRYLQSTKSYMLTYIKSDSFEIMGYKYLDYPTCVDDRKPTSGYIFMMSRGVVLWKSVKKKNTHSYLDYGSKVYCLL